MLREEVEARVRKILVETARIENALAVASDQKLYGPDSLGLSSLAVFEIVMEVEEHFSIRVDDSEIESLNSIDAIVNFVSHALHE